MGDGNFSKGGRYSEHGLLEISRNTANQEQKVLGQFLCPLPLRHKVNLQLERKNQHNLGRLS